MMSGFIWYELMTTDREAAVRFYGAVVGWGASEHENATPDGATYKILSADGRGVGGLVQLTDAMGDGGAYPAWVGYVAVDDADAKAKHVAAAGGRVLMGPGDIPQVGRFAMVTDPGGAAFYLLTPLPRADAPPAMPRMTPGHVGWHELYATDGDEAFAFYRDQFGWSEASIFDMGPMGIYRLFATGGDEAVGGMMTKPPHSPRAGWLFYFVVEGIDAAAGRVVSAGGTIVHGPMEVPDGSWVVQATDPQGALFALVSAAR
jgi:predicted enzyme related to lactoylglutathione lyase